MTAKNKKKLPQGTSEKQGSGLGKGGNAPPKEHQWKPGQSGNPAGRPRQIITDELRKMWDEPCPFDVAPPEIKADPRKLAKWKPRTWGKLYVESALRNAFRGRDAPFNQIYNRLEGKVPLTIQGPEGGPMKVGLNLKLLSQKELDILEKIMEKAAEPE